MRKMKRAVSISLVVLTLMASAIVPLAANPAAQPEETTLECFGSSFGQCMGYAYNATAYKFRQQFRKAATSYANSYQASPTPVVCFGNDLFSITC